MNATQAPSLGETLRKARERKGWQVEHVIRLLAKEGIAISPKTLYSWEISTRQPRKQRLAALCKLLEIAAEHD